MKPRMRNEIIHERVTQKQRVALETEMIARKRAKSIRETTRSAVQPLCDDNRCDEEIQKPQRGICRSSVGGKVYGYYAKVGINNLVFITRIQRQIEDAVRDHITAMEIVEYIKQEVPTRNFPTTVLAAVTAVSTARGFDVRQVLRAFNVVCPAHHWIGRALYMHCTDLHEAIHIWECFEAAKGGRPMFTGGQANGEYTPQKADAQWQRIRGMYIQLRAAAGKHHAHEVDV